MRKLEPAWQLEDGHDKGGKRGKGRGATRLDGPPSHVWVNLAQVTTAHPTTAWLSAEQASAVQPPTDPARTEGDYPGYVVRLADGEVCFVLQTEAEMSAYWLAS